MYSAKTRRNPFVSCALIASSGKKQQRGGFVLHEVHSDVRPASLLLLLRSARALVSVIGNFAN
jgi:hypothetical protein